VKLEATRDRKPPLKAVAAPGEYNFKILYGCYLLDALEFWIMIQHPQKTPDRRHELITACLKHQFIHRSETVFVRIINASMHTGQVK